MRRWQTPGAGDETLVPESTSSAAAMRACPMALARSLLRSMRRSYPSSATLMDRETVPSALGAVNLN